jgi:mono/diheme cytochrome c family protein
MKYVPHWTGLSLALLALACTSARRGDAYAGATLEIADASEREGERVFMMHCNRCHPLGEAGLGPALNNRPFPEFLKRLQVRRGLGAMPAFSEKQISDDELDALMDYLALLRSR